MLATPGLISVTSTWTDRRTEKRLSVPLRMCSIVAIQSDASIVTIRLRMDSFASAAHLGAFNEITLKELKHRLPNTDAESGGVLCREVEDGIGFRAGLGLSKKVAEWHSVVSRVSGKNGFLYRREGFLLCQPIYGIIFSKTRPNS